MTRFDREGVVVRTTRFRHVGRSIPSWRMLILIVAPVLFVACGRGSDRFDTEVVARVGSDAITAVEFRLSYALGFPHSTRGEGSPREAYLQRMIDERLLSLEGYRLGIHKSRRIQEMIAGMRAELLVERIFEREVNSRVKVSDDQIRQAAAREGVSIKLRYLPATSRAAAHKIKAVAATHGFAAAAKEAAAFGDRFDPADLELESDYLAAHQIEPSLLEAVSDLSVGELSDPIAFRGAYILIEVVDVRREAVGPTVAPEIRERLEQIQFQREAKKLAREFVTSTMGSVGLRIRSDTYRRLRRHLWDWHRTAPPDGNLLAALQVQEGASADSLRAMLDHIIMTTSEGLWSVERFLREYPAGRYPLSTKDASSFESDLYDAFGLTLRDRRFVEMAEEQELDTDPQLRTELKRWTDKWVYRAMLETIRDTIEVTASDVRDYFRLHAAHYEEGVALDDVWDAVSSDAREAKLHAFLPGYLQRLRRRYPVSVDLRSLERIEVDDPKSPAAPAVVVLKGHTGRPAFPIVDPHW